MTGYIMYKSPLKKIFSSGFLKNSEPYIYISLSILGLEPNAIMLKFLILIF
jgi:hypothetical protein